MKNKKIIIALVALVLLIGCFIGVYLLTKPKTAKGAKHVSVEVVLADGTAKTYEYDTDAEYLGTVLAEENKLVEGEKSEFGLYMKTVDGLTADESKQEWWCLTKNGGETVMTGIDSTPVADGDKFELTLTVGYDNF